MTAKKDPPPPGKPRGRTKAGGTSGQKHVGPGDVLNHMFEVRRSIGRGGMGEVFEGINVFTKEPVAIKVILPHLAADPQVLAMFVREGATLTRLSHPALVQYRTQAQDPQLGACFIVTEFIKGDNLADILGQIEAEPADLVALTRRLAEGLAAAHRLDAIHRDIAPDNIMLPVGRLDQARIIDFGIAKDLDASTSTIIGDGFAGKLNYVAPEQLGEYGREIGPWTDVYSLALTILAVARRKDVDLGGTLVDAVDKRRKGVDVSAAPAVLQEVLGKMLRHDPAERFRSMEEVIRALDRLDLKSPPADSEPAEEPDGGWGGTPAVEPAPVVASEEGAFSSSWADLPSEGTTPLPDDEPGPDPGAPDDGWTVFLPGKKSAAGTAPPKPADKDAADGKIFGLRPAIAGAIFAAVLLVFAGSLWLFGLGGDDKPVVQTGEPTSQAQIAKAERLLEGLLPGLECTSLTLGEVAWRDGGIAVAVAGVAGTPEYSAAAQEGIDRALRADGLVAKSLDFSAVEAVDANCGAIDVFKRFASRDEPRLSFPQTQWEILRLGPEGKNREGQLGIMVEGLANLAGVTNPAHLLFLGHDELFFSDSPVADPQYADGQDRYRVEQGFEASEVGWWGIVLLSGTGPFDAALLGGDLTTKPDWPERFAETATAQGWTVEIFWIEVVDQIPDQGASAPAQ